jgi:hypothetical protein
MKRGIKFQGEKKLQISRAIDSLVQGGIQGYYGPRQTQNADVVAAAAQCLRSQVNTTNSGKKQAVDFSALKGRKEERKRRAMHQSKTYHPSNQFISVSQPHSLTRSNLKRTS